MPKGAFGVGTPRATTRWRPSRRALLGTATGVALGAAMAVTAVGPAAAQPSELVVIGHAVHRNVATQGPGGDTTEAWRESNGVGIEWLTFGVDAVHERLFREAQLSQGGVDMAFLLDRFNGPGVSELFEDLNEYQARDPIEGFDDLAQGMRDAHTYGGRLIGIPYRHATHGLLYNAVYFAERGLDGPPQTYEELVEQARQLTYTRDDGTQVHGLVFSMDDPSSLTDHIRANGGDFITNDYELAIDEPEAIQAITTLRDLYREGVLPRNIMSFSTEDVITMMQQGRAAMTNQPFGRYVNYNDPAQSQFPGEIQVSTIPALGGGVAPAKTSVWAMAIPKNSPNKDLAWSLIRQLSAPSSTIAQALNGNGPTRISAYDDPGVQELVPYARMEAAVLPDARLTIPAFQDGPRAMDILMEEVEFVFLGRKEPAEAMAEVRRRVEPLLPR